MISTRRTHDAPLLTMFLGAVTIAAVPVVMYVLFTVWPESLERQAAATACVLLAVVFTLFRNKLETLLFAVIFLSQFSVSLHSFDLVPPVILQIFLSDLILALLILVAIERRLRVRLDKLGWLFFLWIGWLVVTCFFSAHLHRSFIFVAWQIEYLLLYVVALNMPMSKSLINKIQMVIIAVIMIQAAIGIAQLLHGGGLGLKILGESFNTAKIDEYTVKGFLRPAGTIGTTGAYAGYLATLLVFLLPFVVTRRSLLFYTCFGAGTIALLISLSRAGCLSFMVGSLCAIFMMWRAQLMKLTRVILFILFASLIVAGVAATYSDKIIDRFENRQAISSAEGRIEQFSLALPLIEKHPIVGIGPGVSSFFGRWNHNRSYVQKALSGLEMPNYIHSGYLQILVESGIPALVLYLAIVSTILGTACTRNQPETQGEAVKLLRVGGISGAIAIMILISFGTELESQRIFSLCWVLLGLARNRQAAVLEREK
jgi:hypothetical protein